MNRQLILKWRPRGCTFEAAERFHAFIIKLDQSDFPLNRHYQLYLRNSGYDRNKVEKVTQKVAYIIAKMPTPSQLKEQEEKTEPLRYGDTDGKLFPADQDALDAIAETRLPEMVKEAPSKFSWIKGYGTVDQEFFEWINSINLGFQYRKQYEPHKRYIHQANEWLKERKRIEECKTVLEREDYVATEILRFQANKLYFLNKYWRFKKSGTQSGFAPYVAYDAQQLIAYLYDCKFDLDVAKARQILFTTTMFGLNVCQLLINYSYFIKIITADTVKAKETFRDKFKSPFYDLPTFIKPKRRRNEDPDSELEFGCHFKKGESGGGSIASIVPPSIDAVNSGSPNELDIDEQGLISIVAEMKNEMKAPSERINKKGDLVKEAQSIAWGTSDMIQFPDFEETFKNSLDIWESGNYKQLSNLYAIPLFLNVFARQGFTKEKYEVYKKQAYMTTGPKRDETIIQFHQSFPEDREDMFMSNPNTLISMAAITESIQRIDSMPPRNAAHAITDDEQPAWGYLVPVFQTGNTNHKTADLTYHAINAEFIETTGPEDARTTCFINRPPPGDFEQWVDRWRKGSDPIMAVSGKSNFATAILDTLHMDICAGLFFRPPDPKYAYQQSMLLNLYYGGISELVENNIGRPYIDYVEENGYGYLLSAHAGLPTLYQIETSEPIGIAKKGNNTRNILNATQEFLYNYYKQQKVKRLFVELKTFVNKPKPTNLAFYEPKNPKINFDDFIDATGYAYIDHLTFQHITPKNLRAKPGIPRMTYKRVRDVNGNLDMVPVMVYS